MCGLGTTSPLGNMMSHLFFFFQHEKCPEELRRNVQIKKEKKSVSINALLVLVFGGAIGILLVCADETLLLCVAELGRDALSIQAAPHDPGAGLQ